MYNIVLCKSIVFITRRQYKTNFLPDMFQMDRWPDTLAVVLHLQFGLQALFECTYRKMCVHKIISWEGGQLLVSFCLVLNK